jgi:multidrug transporter EmrE-like cation transporter
MSLRSFHILFVTISTLLFVFLAVWGFILSGAKQELDAAIGTIGAVGAVIMPIYGVLFYRKACKLHI